MKCFLHRDVDYPDQWWRRFHQLLTERYQLAVVLVDALGEPSWMQAAAPGDCFLGRFGHSRRDRRRTMEVLPGLEACFGSRLFPRRHLLEIYDDKWAEYELLRGRHPTPRTWRIDDIADVQRALDEGARWPLVTKRRDGASGRFVRLIETANMAYVPGILQEYLPGNRGDYRVVVVGRRALCFFRNNRPGDFRASGSGDLDFRYPADPTLLELCGRISLEHGFESMAYDILRGPQGWQVVEMSYAFPDNEGFYQAPWYCRLPDLAPVARPPTQPQDWLLEDLLPAWGGVAGQLG